MARIKEIAEEILTLDYEFKKFEVLYERKFSCERTSVDVRLEGPRTAIVFLEMKLFEIDQIRNTISVIIQNRKQALTKEMDSIFAGGAKDE